MEGQRVGVLDLDLVDEMEIVALAFGRGLQPLEGIGDVVGGQLARFHDAGLFGKHHAPAHLHLDAQGIVLPLPAFQQFAADGVGRQVAVGDEAVLAAVLDALGEVGREQLLEIVAGVVVELPVPVARIERQRRQRHVDGADLECAAALGFFLGGGRGGRRGAAEHECCSKHQCAKWGVANGEWRFAHRWTFL